MSVRLECAQLDPGGAVSLGTVTRWAVVPSGPDIEVRLFLRQHRVRLLSPIRDWSGEAQMDLFPEAPGPYALLAQWREPATGRTGWVERRFLVVTSGARRPPADPMPELFPVEVSIGHDLSFWVPSAWESQFFAANEAAIIEALLPAARPGDTVWDVGANLGIYSVALARQVGAGGRVVAFEANPVCVYFLRLNLARNRVDNCEVLPVALADAAGHVLFALNYGNSNLGVGAESPVFAVKPGQRILVASVPADELVASGEIAAPSLVKIDVEGAEGAVLRGMRNALRGHRPTLLVEMHGRAPARSACEVLASLDYTFTLVPDGTTFRSAADMLAALPDRVFQVIARPH